MTAPGTGVPIEVEALGSVSGVSPYSFAWTFGDGGSATGQDASHTYTSAGNYTIRMTVTAGDKSTCTASGQVLVSENKGAAPHAPVVTSGNDTVTGVKGTLELFTQLPPAPKNVSDQGETMAGTPMGNTSLSTKVSPESNVTIWKGQDPPVEAWRNQYVFNATFSGQGYVAEPAISASGNTVFYVSNAGDALSTDGGSSWAFVNPSLDINGNPWGYCCDQDVVYSPTANIFIWYRQAGAGSAPQETLSVVSPSGSTMCDWKLGPTDVGMGTDNWFDFPQLSTGNGYAYLTTNVFGWPGLVTGGFNPHGTLAIRFPLSELAGCVAGSSSRLGVEWNWVHYDSCFIVCSFLNLAPIERGTGTMYFAVHIDTSTLRVITWPEGASATWTDVSHFSFPTTAQDETCPSASVGPGNPCGFFDDRVRGGWLGDESSQTVYFYWDVKQHDGFIEPYTFILGVTLGGLRCCGLEYETLVSSQFAMVDAFAARNQIGSMIGISVLVAGGTVAPSTAFAVFNPSLSGFSGADFTIFSQGRSNPPPADNRWGDYTRVRPYHGGTGVSWVAAGYRLATPLCCNPGSTVELRSYFLGPTGQMDFNMSIDFRSLSTERDLAAIPAATVLIQRLSTSEETVQVSLSTAPRGINVSAQGPSGSSCNFHVESSPCPVRISVLPNDTAPFGTFPITITGTTNSSHLAQSLSFVITIRLPSGGIQSVLTSAQYSSNIIHFGLRGNGSFVNPSIFVQDRVIQVSVVGDSKKVGLYELDVPRVFLDGAPVVLIDQKLSQNFAFEQNSTYYQVYFSDQPGSHTVSVEGLNTYNSPPTTSGSPFGLSTTLILAAAAAAVLLVAGLLVVRSRSMKRPKSSSEDK